MNKYLFDLLLFLKYLWSFTFLASNQENNVVDAKQILFIFLAGIIFGLGVVFVRRFIAALSKKISPEIFSKRDTNLFVLAAILFYIFFGYMTIHSGIWPENLLFQIIAIPIVYLMIVGAFVYLLGWASIPYFIISTVIRLKNKKILPKFEYAALATSFITLVLFFLSVAYFFEDNGNGAYYFQLDAAIKNTCLGDPHQDHCPHSLVELSYVEPEKFAETQRDGQMIYQYYPDKNEYTLIVRYRPNKAIVFDPRLIKENGVDFQEFEVGTWGKDRLLNPPSFPGPWDQIQEWDK